MEKNQYFVINQFEEEERKFQKTLEKGLKEFNKIKEKGSISGFDAFDLYQTYGFPIEMTKELAKENGLTPVDELGFEQELKKHQELSRTAIVGKFKSGLADTAKETKKLHTATHILLAALEKVLGHEVIQKGSNITAERLRLDFSHQEKLTPEQIKKVENTVNKIIERGLSVSFKEMATKEAKKQKEVKGVFESKYKERVKVYIIGEGDNIFSKEICAGPHVQKTSELGKFKIIKEESSAAGTRRIRAILEQK